MNFEIAFIAGIFLSGLALLFTDAKKSVYALLATSVLLHKELFSVYSWNILPIRVFMAAILVFVVVKALLAVKNKEYSCFKQGISNPIGLSLLAFWLIAGISMFFSKNIRASLSVYAFLTTVVALYFYLGTVLSDSKERVLSVVRAYILVAFILSLIGYIQIYVFEKYQFIFGAFWNVPGHTPRIGSLFWDVNHFAGLLVLLLPVIFSLIITSKWRSKLAYVGAGVSISATLLLTNARSGWIAAGVAFLVFALILIFRRFRYKGLAAIFLLILLVSGGIFSQYLDKQSSIRHKIRQYFHYRLDSFDSHFLLLTGSWQIFEKYPVLGGGYGSFYEHFSKTKISAIFFSRDPAALNTRVPAHSIWGELLAETGILGFTSMLICYFGLVSTLLYASLRLKNKREFVVTSAMTGSVTGILIAGVFYSYNSEFFWITLFLYFFYAMYCLRDEFKHVGSKLWSDVYSLVISNPKFPAVALSLLSALLISIDLGKNRLIPFDEAIYAKISQNIVINNDWLTLYWKDVVPWFEKPPLYFWLSALMLRVLPESPELAVRLPSAIFGFLTVILTFYFGKKLFGKTAGFIAGLSLLTTFHFLYYSRIGMLDVACTFFITASLYFYYQLGRLPGLLLSGIFAGLAVLTKGVVGLLPLVVLALYESAVVFYRIFRTVKSKHHLRPYLVFEPLLKLLLVFLMSALIFLPWHLKMYQIHGQKFIDSYLGYHVLERATMETEDKNAPVYWYAIVLKVSMRLWFIALIPSLIYTLLGLVKNKFDRKKLVFVLIWAFTIFMVFSLSKSKLVWYIIPVYPVLSVIIGYFYSAVLSFADRNLSRLKYVSSFFLKTSVIYLTVVISLMYLFLNKDLVYVSDLTGAKVQMMQTKNTVYGANVKVYLDRIELPLVLFYNAGPFEIVDFTPLQEQINIADKEGRQIIFITKESRFKKLQKEYPAIKFAASSQEWYLGELVGK